MRTLTDIVRLGRPQFWLFFGLLMNVTGALVARDRGYGLNAEMLLIGQLFVWPVNAMTLYANEYFDLAADRANRTPTRWTGGSRVLAEGRLPGGVALYVALLLALLGLVQLVFMVSRCPHGHRPQVLAIGGLAMVLGWTYSGPPLRLQHRGLGELGATLVITGLTPLLGFYLQAWRLDAAILPVLAPLMLVHLCRMLVMNVPDRCGDEAAGKRTLVVLLGPERAVRLHGTILLLAYVTALALGSGLPAPVLAALLLPAPLGLWQAARLVRGAWREERRFSSLALWSTIHLNLTALGLAGALAVAS